MSAIPEHTMDECGAPKSAAPWLPIESAPRDGRLAVFLFGAVPVLGKWQPFWCGSDCPCDVAGEGPMLEEFADEDCEPVCWGVYGLGIDGQFRNEAYSGQPSHWSALADAPEEASPRQVVQPIRDGGE